MSKPTRASIIIREGRKRAGLTQQELADKLGTVSYTHLTLPTNREV